MVIFEADAAAKNIALSGMFGAPTDYHSRLGVPFFVDWLSLLEIVAQGDCENLEDELVRQFLACRCST